MNFMDFVKANLQVAIEVVESQVRPFAKIDRTGCPVTWMMVKHHNPCKTTCWMLWHKNQWKKETEMDGKITASMVSKHFLLSEL